MDSPISRSFTTSHGPGALRGDGSVVSVSIDVSGGGAGLDSAGAQPLMTNADRKTQGSSFTTTSSRLHSPKVNWAFAG
ncbi:MAG: hypothetical protein RIE23_07615 [Pontimonas sp.]